MALTFASAELIALSLEAVLYGLSLSSPLSPFPPHHLIRALRFLVRGMRQRPLQQAAAKGWGQLPPHLGLGDPFHPHNMGSSLLAYITLFSFIPFTAPGPRCHSAVHRLQWE